MMVVLRHAPYHTHLNQEWGETYWKLIKGDLSEIKFGTPVNYWLINVCTLDDKITSPHYDGASQILNMYKIGYLRCHSSEGYKHRQPKSKLNDVKRGILVTCHFIPCKSLSILFKNCLNIFDSINYPRKGDIVISIDWFNKLVHHKEEASID